MAKILQSPLAPADKKNTLELPGYGKASSTSNQMYSDFMGFYSDFMGFYSDLMGYEWDVASGND